ncbi:MAG: penicillin-binding protein 2 [Planctomycetes bacterium]|nr:penicillin-binding protein 2 [Planctomycetota bacterium]
MANADRTGWALHLLFAALAAALLALAGRLAAFQHHHHDAMAERAVRQQQMTLRLPARRGNIYAASYSRHELLATSHQVDGVFADPLIIADEDLDELCIRLGEALDLNPEAIRKPIEADRQARFVWIRREVDPAAAQRIAAMNLRGIGLQARWRRRYPNGPLASHVVGFANVDGVGLEGVERLADSYLRGTDGRNAMLADAARRPIWNQPGQYVPPVDGHHVYLTIDLVIQGYLEEALADVVANFNAESALGVVVDPATGAVLAMASVPTCDPNAFGAAPPDARRNRPVTDMFEPGSIFKPFIASAAFSDGAVRWGETFDCHNGAYPCRRGRVLHDSHPYGELTAEAVVYKSSNIGMAQMGERLGNERMYRIVRAFGFGSPTGTGLPGEVAGQVNPLRQWRQDSTWSVPMGQEVAVTGMQMVMAFSALANDGVLLQPRLVHAVVAPDGQIVADGSRPIAVGQVIDPQVARRFVQEVLGKVPTDGTGRNLAALDGWTSFGKTGTAQIAPYSSGQFTASYIGGAPLNEPRLVCLISVRKPDKSIGYYGGSVAGPPVKSVLERSLAYLGVPRDCP